MFPVENLHLPVENLHLPVEKLHLPVEISSRDEIVHITLEKMSILGGGAGEVS